MDSLRKIKVSARCSPLSQAQVWEIHRELILWHPEIVFSPIWIETTGDKNLAISLRTLEKTDFFTKEVDELVASGICSVSIHAAKDLPEPLHPLLSIVALSKGLDPSDVLVVKKKGGVEQIPWNGKVGTSSFRRQQAVLEMRHDLQCIDIRGNIERRLNLLDTGQLDALVMAEAALLRLNYDRPRIYLKGVSAPFQGRLAILARTGDTAMRTLFACIDAGYCTQSINGII